MERLKTAIGEPHLDSNRGKDVMQQVTGHPKFPYMPLCVPSSGVPGLASQDRRCGSDVTSRR
jgi:hypothetical protein